MLKSLRAPVLRLLPFLATVILCVVGLLLGNWQTHRAEQKEALALSLQRKMQTAVLDLNVEINAKSLVAFQRVRLSGHFVKGWPLYLDNRPLSGVAGFYVVMPFQLHGTDKTILVARGWLPRNPQNRTQMPTLITPEGDIQIEGILRESLDRSMQIGETELLKPYAIIQNLSISNLREQTKFQMLDMVVEQSSEFADGLVRDWPKPSAGSDKNRAYAFQWYGLALMAAIFFVVTGIRRGKN
jgi:surfeit locus 1 family protein